VKVKTEGVSGSRGRIVSKLKKGEKNTTKKERKGRFTEANINLPASASKVTGEKYPLRNEKVPKEEEGKYNAGAGGPFLPLIEVVRDIRPKESQAGDSGGTQWGGGETLNKERRNLIKE